MTLLKELWLGESFAESRDYWREQFSSRRTQAAIREEIYQKHDIRLSFDNQLTHFRQWVEDQDLRDKELDAMLEDLKRVNGICDEVTDEEIREKIFEAYHLRALARGDIKLGKFILRMDLADRKLGFRVEKENNATMSKGAKALQFCLAETVKFPEVQKLFVDAFAALDKAEGWDNNRDTSKPDDERKP